MGLTTIGGLPAHPLLVHLVVVLVPISALLLVASNGWANEAFDNCIVIAEEAKKNSKKCEEISLLNEELK